MRALLAAITCQKGAIDENLKQHLSLLSDAADAGCDVVLFPEMSLTGSADPASGSGRLIPLDHPAVAELTKATTGLATAACFGIAEQAPGEPPHITQVVAGNGKLVGVQRKRHLGDGEEAFSPAAGATLFDWAGSRLGVAICAESGYDDPFDDAAAGGAGCVLFPAAPGLYGRRTSEASWQAGLRWWEECGLGDAIRHARRRGLWIALAGQAGSTVDEDFPGLAALVGPDGAVTSRLPDWRPGTLTVQIPVG
jgi:predicted amidohydrolase